MRPIVRLRVPLPLLAAASLVALSACARSDDERSASRGGAVPTLASASPKRDASMAQADGAAPPQGFSVLGAPAPAEQAAAAPAPPPAPSIAPAAPGAPSATSAAPDATAAMIIRTGTASIQVDSLDRAVAEVRAAAERFGGWVANTSVQGGNDQVRSATLELKIPAARFDALTGSLGTFGKLERLDVTAQDVGEEYVDVTARVTNARRLEARLLGLLERSAGRLNDMLAVEREVARVREEIERYEGRLRFLRTRVSVSTLAVTVHEPPPLVTGQPGTNPIAEAFRDAWRNFVSVVAGVIASLGVVIPLGAIAAFVWFVAVPAVRRRQPPAGGAPPPAAEAPRRDRAA